MREVWAFRFGELGFRGLGGAVSGNFNRMVSNPPPTQPQNPPPARPRLPLDGDHVLGGVDDIYVDNLRRHPQVRPCTAPKTQKKIGFRV